MQILLLHIASGGRWGEWNDPNKRRIITASIQRLVPRCVICGRPLRLLRAVYVLDARAWDHKPNPQPYHGSDISQRCVGARVRAVDLAEEEE